eukprot:6810510-Prymnesium_polylepis.2
MVERPPASTLKWDVDASTSKATIAGSETVAGANGSTVKSVSVCTARDAIANCTPDGWKRPLCSVDVRAIVWPAAPRTCVRRQPIKGSCKGASARLTKLM